MNKCRLCGDNNFIEYFVIDIANIIYKCNNCEFVQLPSKYANYLDDIATKKSINQDKFRNTSQKDMERNNDSNFPDIIKNLAHVMNEDSNRISKFIENLIGNSYTLNKKIKFIDIGSGYGHIGFTLGKNNPHLDVHLLEISKKRMDMGIETFKPDIAKFTFNHKLLDDSFVKDNFEKFDIVLSFHVLEHVYNMVEFIKNMFKITKHGGFIILEVPNEDDDLQFFSENYKRIIHFLAHISYFTKKTLSVLLEKSNIYDKIDVSFIPIQRYGFFNYIDWIRYNKKKMIVSDDYIPRGNPPWIEKMWLKYKKENFTTDSIMMVLRKI